MTSHARELQLTHNGIFASASLKPHRTAQSLRSILGSLLLPILPSKRPPLESLSTYWFLA